MLSRTSDLAWRAGHGLRERERIFIHLRLAATSVRLAQHDGGSGGLRNLLLHRNRGWVFREARNEATLLSHCLSVGVVVVQGIGRGILNEVSRQVGTWYGMLVLANRCRVEDLRQVVLGRESVIRRNMTRTSSRCVHHRRSVVDLK